MKKVLLLATTIVAIVTTSNAQISKGSVFLGGSLNFSSGKTEDPMYESKQKSIGFSPAVGLTIKTNTVLGLQLGYGHYNYINPANSFNPEQESTSFSSEAFLRKYLPLGKDFYFFGQGGVYFNRGNGENKYAASKQEIKGWGVGLEVQPGISYAVNKKFHLEAGLANMANIGFNKSETKTTPATEPTTLSKSQGFNFSSSLSSGNYFTIGFRLFL